MPASRLINSEIADFYAQTSEESRLHFGLGPLELERNKELIQRHLPQRGIVIDVGGGPGVYSEWLANLGYQVYLIDPVEKHIKQANKRSAKSKKPFESILGEAQKLSMEDNFADLVILHGPLYHLQLKKERINAIAEARRVLKPGGIVLGFAITHCASTIAALLNGIIHEPGILEMCKSELISGIHTPPKDMPGVLPAAYFHQPHELMAEIEEAGLTYVNTYAVEGLIWLDKNYFDTRSDVKKRNAIMKLMSITENNQSALSLSPHIMAVGRK